MEAFKTTVITSLAAFVIGATSATPCLAFNTQIVNQDSAFNTSIAHTSGVSPILTRVAFAAGTPDAPAEYLPLGIAKINGREFEVYAFQNGAKRDDVAGQGEGSADVFDSDGHLIRRFAFRENLNSPPQIIEYVPVPTR
jgi:hypothetical protein